MVGRKGAGKTATLYYLDEDLKQDHRNYVCIIKPINFELDGIISLLEKLDDIFEQGFVIESIWKFLIYTEISKSIYDKLIDKPLYALSVLENDFLDFIKINKNIFLSDFSTRLEEQIEKIKNENLNNVRQVE